MSTRRGSATQVARSTPFDPTNCDITNQTHVQGAIEDLCNNLEVTATPGYTWGASGAIKNSYLQNETVPSNKSGRLVSVTGTIESIFITTELETDEYTLEIRRRVGAVFTTILSIPATSGDGFRTYVDTDLAVTVTVGDELTAYILKSGNKGATNPVAGVIIKGTV